MTRQAIWRRLRVTSLQPPSWVVNTGAECDGNKDGSSKARVLRYGHVVLKNVVVEGWWYLVKQSRRKS